MEKTIGVIKLKNSETLICSIDKDETGFLQISEILKINQLIIDNKDGTYHTAFQPMLYFPFGMMSSMFIDKKDILFYDLADNYYQLYHSTCYPAMMSHENAKQEFVFKQYENKDSQSEVVSDNFTTDREDDIITSYDSKPTLH